MDDLGNPTDETAEERALRLRRWVESRLRYSPREETSVSPYAMQRPITRLRVPDATKPVYKRRRKKWSSQARRALTAVIAQQQGNRCALCGHPFTQARPPTLDHLTPVARGGSDARENLQAAHSDCNGLKAAMTMEAFRREVASGRIRLPEPDPPDADLLRAEDDAPRLEQLGPDVDAALPDRPL